MKMIHNYDIYGNMESAIIYLAKPGKQLICALNGIDTPTVSVSLRTNNTSELTFTVNKYIDEMISDGYNELDEMMELYCDGIWYKITNPPVESNIGIQSTKEIIAESYEIMLTQYKLREFMINMGSEGSYEMMYQSEHDTSQFYQVKFHDPNNEDLSFLHIVLKHADVPGWKIGYVDNITPDDDGVLLPNAICNFEVDDQNVYAFLTQEASAAYKCVFEFDTINMTINVYRPDSFGKDTNVVLGFRNIQDSVSITRDDSLITQFYVEGLDNYNIDAVNFGDSVITDLSYFVREPYMGTVLQDKYLAWQNYRESRRKEYADLSKEYNANLEVLTELTNRVPIDTAQTNWFGKTVEDLKDAYDSNMAIIKGLESIYVDDEKNFDLEALKKSSDWSLYESIMNYTLPSIVAALQAQDEIVEGFGKGNVISCVNPVVLGEDWYTEGGSGSFAPIQIDDAPAYGITRGIQVSGTDSGVYQHNITIEPSQRYVLSCFVKGSGTFYLGYNNTGENRTTISYQLTSSWTRVFTAFNLSSRLIDVSFTGDSNFTICGMQLEMGETPSQFGYFTQSENIMKAYETDWKLYGIAELKVKISTYDGCIKELKKNGYAGEYNALAGYTESYFSQMHQKYLDYISLKEQAEVALAERQAEYNAAERPEIQESRNQIAKDVLIENFGKVQTEYPAFTESEIYIIKSLYNQAVYSNENIIVTTLDTTADAVDKSMILYKDAIEELYVESHPQYTYTNEIGNIYALPEFKEYHDQLAVNDFVRVGLSDTKYIKLRVIEIIYNPCDMDETMEVTFSNMVQYKSKRVSDNEFLTNALNQTSNRNGGRVNSVNKSSTSEYVITSDAIKQIFSNPLFNSMLGGATAGGAGSGGTGVITADIIVAELVKANEGVFKKLTVDTAFMKYLDAELISADTITTKILNASQANIEKLSATIIEANEIYVDMANIKNLIAGKVGIGELQTIKLTAENVEINDAVITDLIASKIAVGDLMAQNALAEQIVLVSKNNKPTIAFLESTQQFYDSEGNIRVQIGMDGNGDFNFIVKNKDKMAMFDENGITQTGIPNNTIVNDMINNATITKDKLGFNIIEPNEQGGIDITNIYDGKGNQWWGIEKISITDDYTAQIKNVTDTLAGEIEQKVSNTQYLTDQEAIHTQYSELKQDVSGISSTVSDMKTDFSEAEQKIEANSSSIIQNADKISFIVSGETESEFTLTDSFIKLMTDHISIDASTIDIDGIITAMNTHTGSDTTKIDGGIIDTSTVNAMLVNAKIIQSKNFADRTPIDDIYAATGLQINMETGAFKAKNFGIDDSGNAYFKGNGEFEGKIIANSGQIGGLNGFTILSGKLYSGMNSFDSSANGVYVGIDGIALGGGNFTVDKYGRVYAVSGTFSGNINADSGYIGGWTISGDSLVGRNGYATINPTNLKYGDNFTVDASGYLTASNASISGEINASSGTIGGFTINDDSLSGNGIEISPNQLKYGDDFTVTSDGILTAVDGNFSGTINALSGTIGGFKIASVAPDNTDHAYTNTLYTQTVTSNGDIYQAGIKGESTTNAITEAAFYIRKKSSDATTWTNSDIPFYVRKNGQTFCRDLTIGNTLYMNQDNVLTNSDTLLKTSIIEFYNNSLLVGLVDEDPFAGIAISNDNVSFGLGVNTINLKCLSSANDVYTLYPSVNGNMSLGTSDNHYRTLYVDKIVLGDNNGITTWPKDSGSEENNTPTTLNEINLRVGSDSYGINENYKLYSPNNTNIVVTCSTIGAANSNHTHSNYISKNGDSVNSTLIMANNYGYNCKDKSGTEQTMMYINTSDNAMFGNNNLRTIIRGSTIQLGNTNTNVVLYKGSSTYNVLSTADVGMSGGVASYSHTHSEYISSSTLSSYATQSWAKSTFGDTLSVSGSTLYLKNYNGSTLSYVTLPTSSSGGGISSGINYLSASTPSFGISISSNVAFAVGNNTSNSKGNYISMGNLYNYSGSGGKMVYVNSGGTLYSATSSRRYKHDINKLDFSMIDKLYDLNVVTYKYNSDHFDSIDDPDINKDFIGMIAEDVAAICPSLAVYDSEGQIEMWDQFQFPACLLALIQNNHNKILSLTKENTQLKSENISIKGELSIMEQRLQKLEEKIC